MNKIYCQLLSLIVIGLVPAAAYAHGAEASSISVAYIAGFVLTTAMLQTMGVMLGSRLRQLKVAKITHFMGGMIAMTGLYFVFA